MDLSIIIVNWNSKDYLRKCLASILATTRDIAYEIIVIDSGSFDGCADMLREEFPQVRFIQSQVNLGFAQANNLAAQSGRGECLLFLNPDTEVVGPAINVLLSGTGSLPDAGAVGCRLLNADGTVQTSCIQAFPTILNQVLSTEALRRIMPRSRLWGMRGLFEGGGSPVGVEMISGACLMIRRSVFDRVGHFSTDYFMYAEDLDLCYKARQCGFRNYYCSQGTVVHHGGGSTQQARSNFAHIMATVSIWKFLRKFRGAGYGDCYRLGVCGAALMRLALLVVLAPGWLAFSRGARWKAAWGKWFVILHWGLGCFRWPEQPGRAEQVGLV